MTRRRDQLTSLKDTFRAAWDPEYGQPPYYARNYRRERVPVQQIASPFMNPISQERVDELAELESEGYELPPVIVNGPFEVEEVDYPQEKYPFLDGHDPQIGEDVWFVHDGHHRVMLAIQRRQRYVDALVMGTTQRDAGLAGTPRKATPRRVERWLDFCLGSAIRPNLIIFTGCRNVTMLTARVVEYLGYEAVVMQGRAREWDTKRRVAHIWVEIPELGIGVETNPSQVLGLPVLALVLPLARFKKHTHQFERPEILCEVTPDGERFFDQLAQEVAACVRTKR